VRCGDDKEGLKRNWSEPTPHLLLFESGPIHALVRKQAVITSSTVWIPSKPTSPAGSFNLKTSGGDHFGRQDPLTTSVGDNFFPGGDPPPCLLHSVDP